jgi:hypothetical protein
MANRLPIVKLIINASQDSDGQEHGVERLFFADVRLKEYRSVDGQAPWVLFESEVDGDMLDIIEQYGIAKGGTA